MSRKKEKNTFIAYKSWVDYFDEETTYEEKGMLFDAILRYQNGETDVTPADPSLRVVFRKIKAEMKANDEAYAEVCEKRKKAIDERWKNTRDTNEYKSIQRIPDSDSENDSDSEGDSDSDNEVPKGTKREKTPSVSKREAQPRFRPPTVEEVEQYCFERNNRVDPERFVDFYSSNGWKVGKNPMKDWKAAVRTWEKRDGPDNVVGLNAAQKMAAARDEVLDRIIGGVM